MRKLTKVEKFRLFEIKHKWISYVAIASSLAVPYIPLMILTNELVGLAVGTVICLLTIKPDKTSYYIIFNSIAWIAGIILGIIVALPTVAWIIYLLLFLISIYFYICRYLEDKEYKEDKTSLKLLYKRNEIEY